LTAVVAFMLLAAIVAAASRDLLASVVAAGAVAAAAAAGFVILGAPDLALLHLGAGAVAAAVLLRSGAPREEPRAPGGREAVAAAIGLAGAAVLLTVCTLVYVQRGTARGVPGFGHPVALEPTEGPADLVGPETPSGPENRGVSRLYLDESYRRLWAEQRSESFHPAGALYLPNRVAAVALDYRGYDMLVAAAALLAAVIGAMTVLGRRPARGGGR
jgi:uncharacterized MnhB-related membrane protein